MDIIKHCIFYEKSVLFSCFRCRCEFKAKQKEYRIDKSSNTLIFVANCPECGAVVSSTEEMIIDIDDEKERCYG